MVPVHTGIYDTNHNTFATGRVESVITNVDIFSADPVWSRISFHAMNLVEQDCLHTLQISHCLNFAGIEVRGKTIYSVAVAMNSF